MTVHVQPEMERSPLQTAARLLSSAKRLLVLGGAGMSADAGIPTFRGVGGWWRQMRSEDLASAEAFAQTPQMVWQWYRERRIGIAQAQPHAGQRALALLQAHLKGGVLIATTNEDNLLERAGVTDVVHLHGDIFTTRCAHSCGWVAVDDVHSSQSERTCPRCGAALRPGSIWFGEPLPELALRRIGDFAPDGMLLVGSSCLVKPVSEWPMEIANQGCPVVEVNTEATPISEFVAVSIRARAAEALPNLVDLLTSHTVRDQVRRLSG